MVSDSMRHLCWLVYCILETLSLTDKNPNNQTLKSSAIKEEWKKCIPPSQIQYLRYILSSQSAFETINWINPVKFDIAKYQAFDFLDPEVLEEPPLLYFVSVSQENFLLFEGFCLRELFERDFKFEEAFHFDFDDNMDLQNDFLDQKLPEIAQPEINPESQIGANILGIISHLEKLRGFEVPLFLISSQSVKGQEICSKLPSPEKVARFKNFLGKIHQQSLQQF